MKLVKPSLIQRVELWIWSLGHPTTPVDIAHVSLARRETNHQVMKPLGLWNEWLKRNWIKYLRTWCDGVISYYWSIDAFMCVSTHVVAGKSEATLNYFDHGSVARELLK